MNSVTYLVVFGISFIVGWASQQLLLLWILGVTHNSFSLACIQKEHLCLLSSCLVGMSLGHLERTQLKKF